MVDPEIDVSVVAVLYENRAGVAAFVESLRCQHDPGRMEIVLVDNGSTDGSVELARSLPGVTVIENGVNAGFGMAMNRGIRMARGAMLLLASDDILFRPGALDRMLAALTADPGLGGVGPTIEVPGRPGALYPVMTRDIGLYYGWNFFSGFQARFAGHRLINHDQVDPERLGAAELPWLHGCCALYRRAALESVGGGYDERFFMYFEDADLGRCLRREGWRLRLEPAARVFHHEQQPVRQRSSPIRVHFVESWHRYLRKHASTPTRWLAYPVVLAAMTLQCTVQLARAALGRPHSLPVMLTYLTTHLGILLRDLDRERDAERFALAARMKPLPGQKAGRYAGAEEPIEVPAEEENVHAVESS